MSVVQAIARNAIVIVCRGSAFIRAHGESWKRVSEHLRTLVQPRTGIPAGLLVPAGSRWFLLDRLATTRLPQEQHAEEAAMWHELRQLDQLALARVVSAADQRDSVHAGRGGGVLAE
jgi:hypothetical protein